MPVAENAKPSQRSCSVPKFDCWDSDFNTEDHGKTFKYTVSLCGAQGQATSTCNGRRRTSVAVALPNMMGRSQPISTERSSFPKLLEDSRKGSCDTDEVAGEWSCDAVPNILDESNMLACAIYCLSNKPWILPSFRRRGSLGYRGALLQRYLTSKTARQ